MSSPIAKNKKRLFDKILIAIHKNLSHSKRIEFLSTLYVEIIRSLNNDNRVLNLLDVGCGDMSIAKAIALKYQRVKYTCIDIYPNVEKWDNYVEFDGKNIPFEEKVFDVVLFSDVLHHDFDNTKNLLRESQRVSHFTIIKDHFEYGLWSRRMLQLADFIGNYGYGVSIPKNYFSKQLYYNLLDKCNLKEIELKCPIELYEKSSIIKLFFKSKYQFISLIQ